MLGTIKRTKGIKNEVGSNDDSVMVSLATGPSLILLILF